MFIFCFRITMQEAFSEVDISIINRLSSYIYYPEFKIPKKSPLNVCCLYYLYNYLTICFNVLFMLQVSQPQFNEVIESVNDTNISCSVNFNYLVIKFR